jgi:hypothetical protein
MADYNELFRSDEFRAYRRKQAEEIAGIIKHSVVQLTSGNEKSAQELKGQLGIINRMLRLPESLTGDVKLKTNLEAQLQEDIANITRFLIRESLAEGET